MRPPSLQAQIEEVEYELRQRRSIYTGIAHKRPSEASKLEEHMRRMQAVLKTLKWLRANETQIRAAVKSKPEAA